MTAPASAAGGSRAVRSFLAFDYGTKRVGVATGNTLMKLTQPLRTLALEGDARFKAIEALIKEWTPDALVIGVPFHPDGAAHDNTARARKFGRQLHGRFGLPVHEVDERYTTVDVESASRAPALILEQYFRENE